VEPPASWELEDRRGDRAAGSFDSGQGVLEVVSFEDDERNRRRRVGEPAGCRAKLPVMTGVEVLVALAIAVGLVGLVVPVLPGAILVWAAILLWGVVVGTATGWAVVATATVLIVGGQVVKYAIPGRQLKSSGVPSRSLIIGGLAAIVGFFVVPVVGVFIGFVVGIYASELQRVGARPALPSTRAALRAVGVSMLVELTSALLATAVWIVGVTIT
jgi:uncharacterized protein YqgC (DUF456 family)